MCKESFRTLTFLLISTFIVSCADLKHAGRDIGHATKEVTTEIGHTSRDAVKAIGKETRKAASEIRKSVEE